MTARRARADLVASIVTRAAPVPSLAGEAKEEASSSLTPACLRATRRCRARAADTLSSVHFPSQPGNATTRKFEV